MTISPVGPTPPDQTPAVDHPQRATYDWSRVTVGEWQRWLELPAEELSDREAMLRFERVRVAATTWGERRGLRVQSHRTNHGRTLDLKFTWNGPVGFGRHSCGQTDGSGRCDQLKHHDPKLVPHRFAPPIDF